MNMGNSSLRNLIYARDCRSRRISSWDETGANRDCWTIQKGESVTIAEVKGAGCINHIWITIAAADPLYLRKMLLRMFWDGEELPSVETPIGDFFGVGHALTSHFISLPLGMVFNQEGVHQRAAMNCWFPMPFAEGARIEVANESDEEVGAFYFYVDHELWDEIPNDALRFHAHWRRECPTVGQEVERTEYSAIKNPSDEGNYVILDAEGRGHYVGCVLSIDHIDPVPGSGWFGEGDDMIRIDGEDWPVSLHGTGTEDYFCAAWGYPSGKYDAPYHGISLAGPTTGDAAYSGKWTMYRFHVEDPIVFHKSIRMSIEHGHANVHSDDFSSVAYWYQTEPHKSFSLMPEVAERVPIPDVESLKSYFRAK